MTPMQMLFNFDGRIRRTQYWLWSIGMGILVAVAGGIVLTVTGAAASLANQGAPATGGGMAMVGWIIYLVIVFVAVWVSVALQVKRWHDRDKSWFWVFINFVPIIGGLWALVECGFLDGTQGPNRFGPSPKGIAGPAPAA